MFANIMREYDVLVPFSTLRATHCILIPSACLILKDMLSWRPHKIKMMRRLKLVPRYLLTA